MIAFRPATQDETTTFRDMFRTQLGGSERTALGHLGLSWDELAEIFTTVGEVRSVCKDGDVAGFVWVESRATEVHVHAIVLSPEFRGRGIGRCVFRELEREFSETADVIELGVQKENKGAIRFYRRLGFRPVERDTAPGFLIMRKPIQHDSTR